MNKIKAFIVFVLALALDKRFRAHFLMEPKELWVWFLHFYGFHEEDCDVGGVCEITGFPIY